MTMFFDISNIFTYFVEGHLNSDCFRQLIFNSDNWFQGRVFLSFWFNSMVAMFRMDQTCLAIFEEGHPVTISDKLF